MSGASKKNGRWGWLPALTALGTAFAVGFTAGVTYQRGRDSPSLTVQADPANARVSFVGQDLEYRDAMPIGSGQYTIEVSAEGYRAEQRRIEVTDCHHLAFVKLEPAFLVVLPRFSGEPLTIELKDVPLRQALSVFEDYLVKKDNVQNIRLHPSIRQLRVSLDLKQVPWDQALYELLRANSLSMTVEGNVITVGEQGGKPAS